MTQPHPNSKTFRAPNAQQHGRLILTEKLELEDHRESLQNIQSALYDARSVFDAISKTELKEHEVQSIARLCSIALEMLAEGPAEEAVSFTQAMVQQRKRSVLLRRWSGNSVMRT